MKYPVKPSSLVDYMDRYKLNRADVSRLVKCDPRSVSNWRCGSVPMPYTHWFALRTKVEGYLPD